MAIGDTPPVTSPERRRVSVGDSELGEPLVVELGDGTLGWLGSPEPESGATVTVTGDEGAEVGTARVVRSGTAYEEVRARLRRSASRPGRWRLRRDGVVVLVEPGT
jgi:hypothetical protein